MVLYKIRYRMNPMKYMQELTKHISIKEFSMHNAKTDV